MVTKDTGHCLGATFNQIIRDRIAAGVEPVGESHGVADEATAFAHVSFEGRGDTFVTRGGASRLKQIDINAVDLVAFFEGFSQSGRCTSIFGLIRAVKSHTTPGRLDFAHSLGHCAPRSGRTQTVRE